MRFNFDRPHYTRGVVVTIEDFAQGQKKLLLHFTQPFDDKIDRTNSNAEY